MSLVHPGLVNAKVGTERINHANVEVRQYLQTEYREKDSLWVACGVSKAQARMPASEESACAPKVTECSESDPRPCPRNRLISIAILSENRLTRWLVPKGDSVGER